jgi:hypothetical protein
MVVHPRCPCSRASLAELAVLMAQVRDRLAATVLFVEPAAASPEWTDGDLWETAGEIPGVERVRDEGGVLAARFHLATSGHAVLYGAGGDLLFSGGITAARGHSGDNAGRAAITRLVLSGASDAAWTSVFGCPLFDRGWLAGLRDRVAGATRAEPASRQVDG